MEERGLGMNRNMSLAFASLAMATWFFAFDALVTELSGGQQTAILMGAMVLLCTMTAMITDFWDRPLYYMFYGILTSTLYFLVPGAWVVAPMVLAALAWLATVHPATAGRAPCPAS